VVNLAEKPRLDEEREELVRVLSQELLTLRSALRMNQTEAAGVIGISRQHYALIETGKRIMEWSTFVPLFLYFDSQEVSRVLMQSKGGFEQRALAIINAPVLDRETKPIAVCLYCGSHNPEGVLFCGECGTKIGETARLCSACGAAAWNGVKYCMNCGTKIW
jgi:DNA-binding XRE family transcriptional regulator